MSKTKGNPGGENNATHFRHMTRAERLRALRFRMTERFRRGKYVHPVAKADPSGGTYGKGDYYPISYPYGAKNPMYEYGYHTGEDHACPVGSLAVATSYGTVEYAGDGTYRWGAPYGNQVIIRTADGKYDYAHNHLSEFRCKAGDKVEPGQVVGLTGATGNVTGPHSHFEARPAGGHYGSDVPPTLVKHKRKG